MSISTLSAKAAFLYFAWWAWAFAATGLALGCLTGRIDTGPENAELWSKALYVASLGLIAILPATVWGAIYAAWLRIRGFSTRWRQARLVPLIAGFCSWILMALLYTPLFMAFGEPPGTFLADYSYLFVLPLTPLILSEASFRLLKSIDADIPANPQDIEAS